jgi:spore coat protein A
MEDLHAGGGAPLSRRAFIRAAGVTGSGFVLYTYSPGGMSQAVAAVPGGTIDPVGMAKFVTPLLIPPVMPRDGTCALKDGRVADYYEISVRQFEQQILPVGLPRTTVWGYGPSRRGVALHHTPSLTVEAKWNRPVRIRWVNGLMDHRGDYLPHLLPVDPTLHWANPAGGHHGRDMRPTFTRTPGPYVGPVPMVPHLHGAVGVGDESDGYPEAWFLPAARNIPMGYAQTGTWHDFFARKARADFAAVWGRGSATFQYPDQQRAATLWFHDHTLGMTRLNVYAGQAGFFLMRGGPQGDRAVRDARTGATAVLPGPAPREADPSPATRTYYEIPLVIQDRAFNADGSLFYPASREFFDEATADDPGFVPGTDLSPIWNPEFFGNMITVNGNTWPFQKVEQRRYRLRFLNGCQSRFLILDFRGIPGVVVWAIGNEGGFLPKPVNLTAHAGNQLLMGLSERADLIVDFTHVPVGNHVLRNVGPDEPFGGGEEGIDFDGSDPFTTGQVMQFRVRPALAADPTTPPQFLALPTITRVPPATRTRRLALLEMASESWDGPAEAMLGTVRPDGMPVRRMWGEWVTEDPDEGDTEVWEFYNFTADAHPIHVHETTFELVDRQALVVDDEGESEPPARLVGERRPPEAWERGRKDTVIAYPGEVTRIRATFTRAGQYVWHCHILEHEDNEMMRPFRIGPRQPGQPTG